MNLKNFFLLSFFLTHSFLFGQIETVGIIGTATVGAWDFDTDMTKVDTLDHTWTLNIQLTDGEAKFRANDAWDINWGAPEFPTGIGVPGGDNILVTAGVYTITFNDTTGAYSFDSLQSAIAIVGDATAKGWDVDTDMLEDSNGVFFITIDLTNNGVKFRKDNNWDVNWGGDDFPTGAAVPGGENINIPKAGKYFVTLDTAALIYSFTEIVEIDSVMIIGSATAGGWEVGTLMSPDPGNSDVWIISTTLTDGGAQFTANSDELVWGGSGFPEDTAVLNGDTIPVVAGRYEIEFNTETGEYAFKALVIYESVGIIGSATINGWEGEDIDLGRSQSDSSSWTIRMDLLDGEAKFRANDAWDVNWGGGDFPSGIATQDGPNIPVTAGDYLVTFNSFTGDYSFELIVEYDAVSLVGNTGPFLDWPGDDASRDLFMTLSPDDPQSWSLESVALIDPPTGNDGVKFRADTAWDVNWGAIDFPGGVGTQDGPNIITVAGTYSVSFNSATGEYLFSSPSATHEILKPSAVKLYPNPAYSRINLDISALDQVKGDVNLQIIDMTGKTIATENQRAQSVMSINVHQLQNGNYLLQVVGDGFLFGKKFTVIR